jgi:hypothetical protein
VAAQHSPLARSTSKPPRAKRFKCSAAVFSAAF